MREDVNFLITGLPRSKTAWMSSVAATVAGAMCYHEPVKRHGDWHCCFEIWDKQGYPHVGIADSSLGFHLPEILTKAAPRVLIINRDIDQVKRSLVKIGACLDPYVDWLSEQIRTVPVNPLIACVEFEALSDLTIVTQCLRHLMPSCAIDEDRILEMLDMNVQADMQRIWQYAIDKRSQLGSMLGPEVMAGLRLYQ